VGEEGDSLSSRYLVQCSRYIIGADAIHTLFLSAESVAKLAFFPQLMSWKGEFKLVALRAAIGEYNDKNLEFDGGDC
jgi:hypothetical protein